MVTTLAGVSSADGPKRPVGRSRSALVVTSVSLGEASRSGPSGVDHVTVVRTCPTRGRRAP